jgi:hypothetical protein
MARQRPLLWRNSKNIFFLRVFMQRVPSCYGLLSTSLGLLKALGETA